METRFRRRQIRQVLTTREERSGARSSVKVSDPTGNGGRHLSLRLAVRKAGNKIIAQADSIHRRGPYKCGRCVRCGGHEAGTGPALPTLFHLVIAGPRVGTNATRTCTAGAGPERRLPRRWRGTSRESPWGRRALGCASRDEQSPGEQGGFRKGRASGGNEGIRGGVAKAGRRLQPERGGLERRPEEGAESGVCRPRRGRAGRPARASSASPRTFLSPRGRHDTSSGGSWVAPRTIRKVKTLTVDLAEHECQNG